jgi:NAD(P)H-dependent flavin oxidoreductase YrpB (nitropropane dioxygenase family)
MWIDTPATRLLKIQYPIIQGPFGGGASSVELAATVSNLGRLGSGTRQTQVLRCVRGDQVADRRRGAEADRRGTLDAPEKAPCGT